MEGQFACGKAFATLGRKSKTSDEVWRNEKTKKMYFEMLNSQRSFLMQANRDPSLNEEIVRHQLYLIDLEEERIKLL